MTDTQLQQLEALLDKWSDRAIECGKKAKEYDKQKKIAWAYGEKKEAVAILQMVVDIKTILIP